MAICVHKDWIKSCCLAHMEKLDLCNVFFEDFLNSEHVYVFDGWRGKKIEVGTELHKRIKELEQRSNVKVYAVTHDHLAILGETYSFLCISPYYEDWEHLLHQVERDLYMVYAYVWNVSDDNCSEFGYVTISARRGGLRRVG